MTSEKVLIIGAGGFVGPYLCEEFDARGYDVVAADRSEANGCYPVDITDYQSVSDLICSCGPTCLVNLAGMSSVAASWRSPQLAFDINTVGAINVLEAVRHYSPSTRILLIGSSEEYSPSARPLSEPSELESNNPYGISKVAQERLAELYRMKYGVRVSLTRSFNHTGPGQRASFVISSWCKQAVDIERGLQAPVIRVGNVEVKRDFTDVRDVVRAYRMIIEHDACDVYNVGSGKSRLLSDMLSYIRSCCSTDFEVFIDSGLLRPSDTPMICADISKIKREIGWIPEIPFERTVEDMLNWYRRDNA